MNVKNMVKRFFRVLGYEIKKSTLEKNIEFLCDEKYEIEFTRLSLSGDEYFVPKYAFHRPAVKDLLNGKLYEPDTHDFVGEFFASFNGSMIHAGTFFGDMIPDFSKVVQGKVYAFEPVFENYALAKLCLNANDLNNVILINAALSDDFCNLYINTNEGDGRHAGGASMISDKGIICAAINIDRLHIEDLVLIQLDVEGHELIALTGAQSTIKKCRPVIAIEDNNNNCSEYLNGIRYSSIGQIPGLTIWAPLENQEYINKIGSFLNRYRQA